ncbi:hypothetical protein CRYUN_Cryun04dG0097000 [Craigia yunnanensis]
MITAWEEFTFTLEDVHILFEHPCLERHDICSFELFEEEKEVRSFFCDLLKSEFDKSKAARFSNWIGLFFLKFHPKKGEDSFLEFPDHEYELEALLIMWLARHLFPGCLGDGISPTIIPIAIKSAKGMHFSLALFYLRYLYKRLDLYLSKSEISADRYMILTYVNVSFIQMCFWNRFSACAPTPNLYPSLATSCSKNNYRALA